MRARAVVACAVLACAAAVDHYKTLGVSKRAKEADIKKASGARAAKSDEPWLCRRGGAVAPTPRSGRADAAERSRRRRETVAPTPRSGRADAAGLARRPRGAIA